MKLIFYGGASEVTGSLFYFETTGLKFLVDCGMLQEGSNPDRRNHAPFPFEAKKIDFLIITHAHLDHIGLIPKLYHEGFRGTIYCTEATKTLLACVLEDFFRVNQERDEKHPLDASLLPNIMKLVFPCDYYKTYTVKKNIYFTLKNSGHILGSAFAIIAAEGKKILVTGDLGNSHSELHKGPDDPENVDYVITEAVYGSFIHKVKSRKREALEDEIEEIITRKGALMIPSFALDRAQELLYDLHFLTTHHKIPYLPIFFDSPLAIEITQIYRQYANYFSDDVKQKLIQGDEIFDFPGLKVTRTKNESTEINNVPTPKIIIAGSGMSNGGRILFHELRYLSDPQSTLLIIGWQAFGTLGRLLLEKPAEITILGKTIPVKAKITIIDGYSGHPDQQELLSWFTRFTTIPTKVFIAQSEKEHGQLFLQLLRDRLGLPGIMAERNKLYQL